MILWWIGIFIVSLVVLIKASDYFTDSAEKIGLYLGMPAFIVGVTIVAIGTSLPELVSSLFAVIGGHSEIVAANVIGSNIANIFLILGVAAVMSRKLKIGYELKHVDLPILVGSAFFLALTLLDGEFSIFEALLCLFGLVIYSMYTLYSEKLQKDDQIQKEMKSEAKKMKITPSTIVVLIVSGAFIFLGAKFTIDAVIQLASLLPVSTDTIAVTAVALGTSLPELMVTISAAKRGKPEMAVGNVLGSNIFNTFAVMGFPALIGSLTVEANTLTFSLPVMVVGTLLFFFITQDREVTKWEGWVLLMFYVFFIGTIVTM